MEDKTNTRLMLVVLAVLLLIVAASVLTQPAQSEEPPDEVIPLILAAVQECFDREDLDDLQKDECTIETIQKLRAEYLPPEAPTMIAVTPVEADPE